MRTLHHAFMSSLVAAAMFGAAFLSGCADDPAADDPGEGDGPPCVGAKCDAINEHTDPATLGFTIKYELAPPEWIGVALQSDLVPYSPPTYYPFTSDGINNHSGDKKSAAEKFDLAFSGWKPDEAFWSLDRLDSTSDDTFDPAYYEQLGPVALWEHNEHGLGRRHDGIDNDDDGKTDLDDDDAEGLESWFGYCNGNTAASLSVAKPLHAATVNEVEFTPNDIMALLAAVHYGDRATMSGLRCESLHPAKDEYGRLVDQPWFKMTGEEAKGDLVSFEINDGPMWLDADQEFVAYRVSALEPEAPRSAMIRLPIEEFKKYRQETKAGEITFDSESWEAIEFSTTGRGCRDTNPATIYLAVTHLLGKYKIPFGIDADSGSHVWNYPIDRATITEQKKIELADALTKLGIEGERYPFNDAAVGFAHVKLNLESSHYMSLEMILELDGEDKVIGGEWVGGSKTRHPDFVWVSLGADDTGYNTDGVYMTFGDDQLDGRRLQDGTTDYTDAPGMAYSSVRRLHAASRTAETETFAAHDGEGADVPEDASSTLTVTVEGEGARVVDVLVYLDIAADFTPGVKVELVSPEGTTVKLFDVPYENREWAPGRFPTGWDLGVLRGVAHPMPLVDDEGNVLRGLAAFNGQAAAGEWHLNVTNVKGGNATVHAWSLWLTATSAEEPPPVENP